MPGTKPTARVLLKARPTEAQLLDRLSEPIPPGLELYLDAEDVKNTANIEHLAYRLRSLRPFPDFVYLVEGPIRSIDGSFFDLSANTEANRECLLRVVSLAEAVESEAVLIHAITPMSLNAHIDLEMRQAKLEASLSLLEYYVRLADERGLVPLLENIPPVARQREGSYMCTPIGMSSRDLVFFIDRLPELRVALDLSHAGLFINGLRMDPREVPSALASLVRYLSTLGDTLDMDTYIRMLEPYIYEAHISNARGLLDEGLPYEDGDLDLDALAVTLAGSARYLVTETIEPNPDKGIFMREAQRRLELALDRRRQGNQNPTPTIQTPILGTKHSFSQEELLGRRSYPLELIGVEEQIAGRRVLVTGAAGSVGTPLANKLIELQPELLLLLDHHEHSLFRLRQELAGSAKVATRCVLADVRDRGKLERIFKEFRPEVVFHLAAYKHVPMGEENPDQTVEVNLGGTRGLIEIAAGSGVRRFVYPSSDKAVYPPSVYGGTKRIAESLTLAANSCFATDFSVTRFVNIVGTRGSVIETLTMQIEAGLPLTLTDPRMTRYWITMPEALHLLLHTMAAPTGGVVYMADLGPPINLVEMARHLFNLLRPESAGKCPIRFIGCRPGERMHEILLSENESTIPTPYPGIVQVISSREALPSYDVLSDQIDTLLETAALGELSALRGRVLDLANTLQ